MQGPIQAEPLSNTTCPACRGSLIGDVDKGEMVCNKCGFVAEDQRNDQGPEWKAMDLEEKEKRVRVGSPRTMTLHDYGLSTEIGRDMQDSQGNVLDSPTREMTNKMRKWHSRVRTSNSRERGLSNVLNRITEISGSLNLPKAVSETAAHIYRTTVKRKVARNKSISGMAAASVYLSCRKCGVSRTLKEIGVASVVETRVVARYFRLVLKGIEQEYIPPPSVEKYISRIVNTAKISTRVERIALQIANSVNDTKIFSGKAPAGLAAAYIYIASMIIGDRLPQREIADVAEVTEVTVRNRCREILNNYVIKQRLSISDVN